MRLDKVAKVRTGAVISRNRADTETDAFVNYRMLNLKCIDETGRIDTERIEMFRAKGELSDALFTHTGDILVRLSTPYTAVLIDREDLCGLLVPSHFAIISAYSKKVMPEYLLWLLRQDSTYREIQKSNSGSFVLGTISSGFFESLDIKLVPKKAQRAIGSLCMLSAKEQELLRRLAELKAAYCSAIAKQIYNKSKGE